MSINDRIAEIIKDQGMTIASFSRKIDVGDQTVRSVCVMKRNKPSFEFLSKLVQTFEWLNPKWLLTGDGEMRLSENEKSGDNGQNLSELIAYLREKDSRIEELIAESTTWRVKYEISQEGKS